MLEQLLNLVRDNAQDAVVNNQAIPNEQNDAVIGEATHSITDGLQQALAGGGFKNVLQLLGGQAGNAESHPVVNDISNNFMNSLMSKFGMDGSQAQSVAGSLIPTVMNKLIHKTNDAGDSSFDLQGIFNSLTGGKTSGLNLSSMLSSFGSGLDKDGDGDVDMQDVMGMLGGGQQGGGLGGMLKGFMGGK